MSEDHNLIPARRIGNIYCGTCSWTDRTLIEAPGDRESTGLVTRFTAHKSKAIREALATAQAAAGGAPAAHLDEITLYDLSEYFQSNFSARITALSRVGYWDGVIAAAGRLPLEQRAKLYAMFWGGIDAFTALFVELIRALEQLGFAQEARAELGALVPRESSIIDVILLQRFGTPQDKADPISVRPVVGEGLGAPVLLPRAAVSALVAELKIVMTDSPWPFFAHTDLLDFPGARSRLKLTGLPADPAARSRQVRELLLRGKIAYVFQRFTEERELTSMLLCMPPSVAEVKDLASMVKSWIDATHGSTPRQRAQVRSALFLILTAERTDARDLRRAAEGRWRSGAGRGKVAARTAVFCRLGRGAAPARPQQHQLRRRPRDRRGAEPQARPDPRDDRHRAAGSRGARGHRLSGPSKRGGAIAP